MSEHIVRVKLLSKGMKGLEYHAEDNIQKDNITIKGFNKRTFPIPIPMDIRDLIQRMKRYMLHMSGHWIVAYDQYISKGDVVDITDPSPEYYEMMKLFQNTQIEEIGREKGKYSIKGYYLNEWKFPIKIIVGNVTIDTGYTDYNKLNNGMEHIFGIISEYINERNLRMMNAKQYMMAIWDGKSEMQSRLEGLDDNQLEELQAKMLEQKGFIVIKQEGETDEIEEENAPGFIAESVEEKEDIPDMPMDDKVEDI